MTVFLRTLFFGLAITLGAMSVRAELDAYQVWRSQLFDALAATKDANDDLALYLLSGHEAGSDYWLKRAYVPGSSNAKAAWVAAVALPCPDQCARSSAAAHDLVKADPGNALAWLTLAYVVERDAGITKEVTDALKRAEKATRLHDYGFDLIKLMIAAAGRVPPTTGAIAAAPGKPRSADEFQLQHGDGSVTVGSHLVMEWIEGGCTSRAATLDEMTGAACAAANAGRQRGDSLSTLGSNSAAGRQLQDVMRVVLAAPTMVAAKERLQLYAEAPNEREFIQHLAKKVGR